MSAVVGPFVHACSAPVCAALWHRHGPMHPAFMHSALPRPRSCLQLSERRQGNERYRAGDYHKALYHYKRAAGGSSSGSSSGGPVAGVCRDVCGLCMWVWACSCRGLLRGDMDGARAMAPRKAALAAAGRASTVLHGAPAAGVVEFVEALSRADQEEVGGRVGAAALLPLQAMQSHASPGSLAQCGKP